MNGNPVWLWVGLVVAVLYAAGSLVVLGLSFGWRRQVLDLRRQVEAAELMRPELVAIAEQQLDQVDGFVQAAREANRQLLETAIRVLAEMLLLRVLPFVLPARWRRLGQSLARQGVRQGAALLAPRLTGTAAAREHDR